MLAKVIAGWLLVISALLAGCAVSNQPIAEVAAPAASPVETVPPATPTLQRNSEPDETVLATPAQSTPSATPTIISSATPTATTMPTETPTTTASPISLLPPISPAICTEPPIIYDLRTLLGMSMVTNIDFLDENTLQVEGWRPRSNLGNPSSLDNPTWIFNRTVIDLVSGELTPVSIPLERLLQTPCPDCAGTAILDESPDGKWQLIVTTAGDVEGVGVWLVSDDTMTQLMLNMPTRLKWVWADDSSLLWVRFYTPEYSPTPEGHYFLTVELGPTPTLSLDADLPRTGASKSLHASQYTLAFSPAKKQILSMAENNGFDDDATERYFSFDAASVPPTLISGAVPIDGLRAIVWDEALDSFLLIVAGEDVIEFRTLDGRVVSQLHASAITPIFPLVKDKSLGYFIRQNIDYALSADRQRVAIGYGGVEGLAVIDCLVEE